MFGMLGVFAEFERSMIQERVRAGRNQAGAAAPEKKEDAITGCTESARASGGA
jgi:DNA invertase Pin-like site-specific DNA recombinase